MSLCVMATKTTKTIRSFNQNENKACLVLNLERETKQTKMWTWHMQNKNQTRFYCKEKTKTLNKVMIINIPKTNVE
jgi:hypothetical protein